MSAAQTLLLDFDVEISNTRRTLERIPDDNPEFKPHEKSMPLGKLAMHCATMPLMGVYIMEDAAMDAAKPTRDRSPIPFTTRDACLKVFDEAAAKCRSAIAPCSDEHLDAIWPFTKGDYVIYKASRALTFRHLCFNHLIHHTAQLGLYLKFAGIAVPALYGPSADEPWQFGK